MHLSVFFDIALLFFLFVGSSGDKIIAFLSYFVINNYLIKIIMAQFSFPFTY